MPIYPIKCSHCHFAGDCFAKVSDLDGNGCVACPECGNRAEQNYAAKTVGVGNREFYGQTQESLAHAFHPSEVTEARETFGADGANCIQSDGSVRFKDRQEQRRFRRKWQTMEAQAAQKRKERKRSTSIDE